MTIRRTSVLLPNAGRPSRNIDGFRISRARLNQLSGSQQTVAPVSRLRPSGTPMVGEPPPTANGNSPHTCTVVPRHSGGAST
jgi:hypothetical protein